MKFEDTVVDFIKNNTYAIYNHPLVKWFDADVLIPPKADIAAMIDTNEDIIITDLMWVEGVNDLIVRDKTGKEIGKIIAWKEL